MERPGPPAPREAASFPARPDRIATLPNALSAIRLASVPVFLWLFLGGRAEGAVALFAAAAMTDFFDGYIARRIGAVTTLGKLLDPLADRVVILALALALLGRDLLPLWLAIVIVARDVLVLSVFPVLERRGMPRIEVNFTGKTATAALLIGLVALAYSATSFPAAGLGDVVGYGFTLAGAMLYWVAAAMYAREAAARMRMNAPTDG